MEAGRTLKSVLEQIDKLEASRTLSFDEWVCMLAAFDEAEPSKRDELAAYAAQKADALRRSVYGTDVYIRGLIEITNYCRNDCYYCGIRRSNASAERYRLTDEEILACCEEGHRLGFRTFVMQGGEDPGFDDERVAELVSEIKERFPDCAVTLSLGERPKETYKAFYDAGADRYLLRHETADEAHYRSLHPEGLSLETRKKCLWDLKEIGFAVGAGFMLGSPHQTAKTLAEDMMFLQELEPHMVGIGPFIPHHDTPMAGEPAGTAEKTCFLLSLIRLMLPHVLLPSTTALGTIHPKGREMGIRAGANVVMPNLTPLQVRKNYLLYDNKIGTGAEAAEGLAILKEQMEAIGYRITVDRGDPKV